MASQRQPRAGGRTASGRGAAGPRPPAGGAGNGGNKGGKAAAGRAQSRAAQAARAAAADSPPVPAAPASRLGRLLAKAPPDLPAAPRWLQWTTFLLTLAGLGDSIYLTIVELRPAALFCSSTGLVNCGNVLHSPQGKIFGIAVAYFGLAFYIGMVFLNSPWAWRRRELLVRRVRLASFIVGICFVLYLVYAELIEIGNICLYCTGVHIITFLLFALIVFDSTFRHAPASTPAPGR
jgi:uncharacterized membrane protein